MASEMLRPTVVTFLDTMLRSPKAGLRVEEITLGPACTGRALRELRLDEHRHSQLLAIRTGSDWAFKPPPDHVCKPGDILVFMTTAEERLRLQAALTKTSGAADAQAVP